MRTSTNLILQSGVVASFVMLRWALAPGLLFRWVGVLSGGLLVLLVPLLVLAFGVRSRIRLDAVTTGMFLTVAGLLLTAGLLAGDWDGFKGSPTISPIFKLVGGKGDFSPYDGGMWPILSHIGWACLTGYMIALLVTAVQVTRTRRPPVTASSGRG
jgi:hypothetical protein